MGDAIVIGAGIGGLAAALALERQGWNVTVLERAAALENVGAGLAVAPNGLRALDHLGVGGPVRALAALQGTAGIQKPGGGWISRTDAAAAEARFGQPTIVVHRAALVSVLADALRPGTLRLGRAAVDVSPDGTVVTEDGPLAGALVVAADGLRSRVRGKLFPDSPQPVYAGVTSWRFIVPRPPGELVMSETWGDGQVFGVVGLGDGRIYCFATAPAPPDQSAPDEKAELARLFAGWHAPIPAMIAAAGDVIRTDIRCLDPTPPVFHQGRVALLGDAAHAMTPNLGQGACQALEDAVVLASTPEDLAAYSAARVPRTTTVAANSRRIGRMAGLSGMAATARNVGMALAGKAGPNLVLRQMDPIFSWRPPS
ncbi:FAD-dependent monooxygenase [Actinoplanes bogorensis]|uniref:FAD-dependent monooxygenase n=1 Tax=Paractinoplanes bogorensis TaxID=1610840 RepID=A0ABS5YT40_9ACTN|nr:FAD-dependent monooxygenase [Actinoplanes bogorensis]MBU2666626.1 FAD-dependent monooxygenase [Actinoplanes bogorensis]